MINKIEFQRSMEERYSKYQLMKIIKEDLWNTPSIKETIENNKLDKDSTLYCLAQLILRKRVRIETMVGLMKKYADSLDEVANMIYKIGLAELYTVTMDKGTLITKYELDKELEEKIGKFQFLPPMIIRPNKLRSNKDMVYLTVKLNHVLKCRNTKEDICLDHLNRVNRIPLKLNMDVAWNTKCRWKNIDKKKEDESMGEWLDRRKQFDKYVEKAYETMELINSVSDEFYMIHGYDKRGRVYPRGYHVNPQGVDWNKAVVEFKNKEIVNG